MSGYFNVLPFLSCCPPRCHHPLRCRRPPRHRRRPPPRWQLLRSLHQACKLHPLFQAFGNLQVLKIFLAEASAPTLCHLPPAPARDARVVRRLGALVQALVLRLVQRLHVRHLSLVTV